MSGEQLFAAETTAGHDQKTASGTDEGKNSRRILWRLVAPTLCKHGTGSNQHYKNSKDQQKLFHEDEPLLKKAT